MFVVITAPHAVCPQPCADGRQCDCAAELWARKLFQKLQDANILSTLLIPLTPRAEGDFNRYWTRDTPYRRTLTAAMQSSWLVLDIHSYPPPHWEGYDAVILDDRRPAPTSLLSFSQTSGIPADLRGQGNDIQDEAHARGIEAFLIEFNEKGNVQRQSQFIDGIVAWIKRQRG
jgi:hypothetical protein